MTSYYIMTFAKIHSIWLSETTFCFFVPSTRPANCHQSLNNPRNKLLVLILLTPIWCQHLRSHHCQCQVLIDDLLLEQEASSQVTLFFDSGLQESFDGRSDGATNQSVNRHRPHRVTLVIKDSPVLRFVIDPTGRTYFLM